MDPINWDEYDIHGNWLGDAATLRDVGFASEDALKAFVEGENFLAQGEVLGYNAGGGSTPDTLGGDAHDNEEGND